MRDMKMPGAANTGHDCGDNQRRAATGVARNDSSARRRRQVLRNAKGKVCGSITGRTLRKTVSGRKHRLDIPPAWALDIDHVETAERSGVTLVELYDRDDGSTWSVALSDFVAKGFRLDRGHGLQIALPLVHWEHRMPGTPVQLRLW